MSNNISLPKVKKWRRAIRIARIAVLVIAISLIAWTCFIEPSQVSISEHAITIKTWHKEHDKFKIAVLTDLHVGSPHISLEKLKLVVARTNEQQPDLTVILGDLVIHGVVGGHFVEPEPIAEILKGLQARNGVVAVLGNHDWWYDGHRVIKALQQAGITVLENDAIHITPNGQGIWVAGLADYWTRNTDVAATMAKIKDNDPIVMLTHNPDIFPELPPRVELTLAGHTHGGQVNFPLIGRPVVPSKFGQRYAYGHIIENGHDLFVSGGIGTSILPVRFRVTPEIAILVINS